MTTITADKISSHDMLGSVISVNCSWPEFFCFGSRRISACKLRKKWIVNLGNKSLDLFSYCKQKWCLESILNQTVSKTRRSVDTLLEHLYEITFFFSCHLYNYYFNNIHVQMLQ